MSAKRYTMLKCFGYSEKKRGLVGERHRWPYGWGQGRCVWCYRYLDQLMIEERPASPKLGSNAHLSTALQSAE